MKYRCIIVDDEPLARELIQEHLSHFEQFELVGSFENALKAYDFLSQNKVDLLFLDIEMPVLKGNELIKKLQNPPKVIMTTAHREYALEGYEWNVVDYLLKPITFNRFFSGIEKFKQNFQPTVSETPVSVASTILVDAGSRKIRLSLDEIVFIESERDYSIIHLENQFQYRLKYNISELEKLLSSQFIRIHRSFILNKNKITVYTKTQAEIYNKVFPVGSSYKENWFAFLETIG